MCFKKKSLYVHDLFGDVYTRTSHDFGQIVHRTPNDCGISSDYEHNFFNK